MCPQAQYIFLHQSTLELLNNKGNSQSIWFVSYSALEKMDSLDAMEGNLSYFQLLSFLWPFYLPFPLRFLPGSNIPPTYITSRIELQTISCQT